MDGGYCRPGFKSLTSLSFAKGCKIPYCGLLRQGSCDANHGMHLVNTVAVTTLSVYTKVLWAHVSMKGLSRHRPEQMSEESCCPGKTYQVQYAKCHFQVYKLFEPFAIHYSDFLSTGLTLPGPDPAVVECQPYTLS